MDQENIIRRRLPNSLEAEQSVIGSMILSRDAVAAAVEILTPEDFYQKKYGLLFQAMYDMFARNEEIDLVTLQNKLREMGTSPEDSALENISSIVAAVPTTANIKYYAQIVRDKSVLRSLIQANEEIENECYADQTPVPEVLEHTEKKIFQLLQTKRTTEFTPIREIVLNSLQQIQKVSKAKSSVTGIPTGFTDLDKATAGMQPSDLILVAARPSMGKTAFVLNIAEYVAFKKDKCVAIFSLEMSKEQLVNRLFAMESRVNAQNIRTGNLTDADWENLIEGAGIIGKSRLIIDDTPGITLPELRSKCRKFLLDKDKQLELVIIDYLQLMGGAGRGFESRQQEISDISRGLKALARELKVPVIALSQLSRAVETRPDKHPQLSDLRESGAIEQDADVVMFIYRDDYYHEDSEDKGVAEIIIAKQRNGPLDRIRLVWKPEYTRFYNKA